MLLVHHAGPSLAGLILRAVQAVTAVAVAKRTPVIVASDSSPTKSPAERSAIVASFPPTETTVTVARPGLKSPSSNSGYNQEPRTLGFGEGNRFVGV